MSSKRKLELQKLTKKVEEKRAHLEKRGDILLPPSLNPLPSDFTIPSSSSLYALPPELIRPIFASAYSTYSKDLSKAQQKAKEEKNTLRCYINLCKRRERFRQKLINKIYLPEEVINSDIVTPEEKQSFRYQYYIQHGIDTIHVAPISNKVFYEIDALIPKHLKKWEPLLKELKMEIEEDYIFTMKKSTVDYVLQEAKFYTNFIQSKKMRKRYRPDKEKFARTKERFGKILYCNNPCIAQLLDLWNNHFNDLRLIDTKMLKDSLGPFSLVNFQTMAYDHIFSTKTTLTKNYYEIVKRIFVTGQQKGQLPPMKQTRRVQNFYNCVATLMTSQLQSLCLKSLYDYVDYLTNLNKNVGFQLNLILKANAIAFEPSFKAYSEVLIKFIDEIVDAVMGIARLEEELLGKEKPPRFLKPFIDEAIVNEYKKRIENLLIDQRIGPELYVIDFDAYLNLINGQWLHETSEFLLETNSFQSYIAKIDFFREISKSIQRSVTNVTVVGMYELNRKDFIQYLITSVQSLCDLLINRLCLDYQKMCKHLTDTYQLITDKLLAIPTNAAELLVLITYRKQVENEILHGMKMKLGIMIQHIVFLCEKTEFSITEIKLNNITFQWYLRMPSIIKDCDQIISKKTVEFEKALIKKVQRFKDTLEFYATVLEKIKDYGDFEQLPKYHKKASKLEKRLFDALIEIKEINEEERAFAFNLTEFPLQNEIYDKLVPYKKLYDNTYDFVQCKEQWLNSKIGSFAPGDIENKVGTYQANILKLEQFFVDNAAPQTLVIKALRTIDEFKKQLPIIHTLGNPGMKQRHWEKASELVGFPIKVDDELTLMKIIDYGLDEYTNKFVIISESAIKENNLEESLNQMTNEWEDIKFTLISYRDTGTYILSSIDDIQQLLDDHIVKSQTMKNSPYIKPFEQEIISWEAKLLALQEILDEWLKVQSNWIHLEPIFSAPDIQTEMPEEGRRFGAVDKMWRDMMKTAESNPKVLNVINIEKMLERLVKCTVLLDLIQKGLNDYLEKKRLYFPRFFFLSNEELLAILSETKNPRRVQPHLSKCFQGIAQLKFTENLEITHMLSHEEEQVVLRDAIDTEKAKGQVEIWLRQLDTEMKKSVHMMLSGAIEDYLSHEKQDWMFLWPGQSIQCVSMLYWTSHIHKAIEISIAAQENYLTNYNQHIDHVINLLNGKLSSKDRMTLETLIILDIHARDVLINLIRNQVKDLNDFQWLCQMRYYWKNSEMEIKMINSTQMYGYEYLGNTGRLIITPLTERCFRTLFIALHFNLGGAAEGPTGTGKTETVKDLSKATGKQCVLFNCCHSLDHLAFAKFFKGLASCGAWCCFDDFNRIHIEVVSVVAQQILTIQRGISSGNKTLVLDKTQLSLNPTCAIFITINPDYSAQLELPDNFKVLFRPVAMLVPDFILICETELFSKGFVNAKILAVKIVTTLKLCFEQLSSQSHYDYGIRVIKVVLKSAGEFKLNHPEENETIVILNSIINVNLSKFLPEDVVLFHGIILDLFPGIILPQRNNTVFNATVEETCRINNIECTDFFLAKVQQLYEMILVRHGLMIVGLPFAGKTTTYRILADTLGFLAKKESIEHRVIYTIINPKSITLGQLYGEFDPITHEWCDGILSVNYRSFALSTTLERKWLIFDGPVDSLWIENLNTVLDDNRKLCLMSGEVIQLATTTNLIFETMDLDVASPATVSRCGVIYIEATSIGWKPLFNSWINKLPPLLNSNCKLLVRNTFERFATPLLWLIRKGKEVKFRVAISGCCRCLACKYKSSYIEGRTHYLQDPACKLLLMAQIQEIVTNSDTNYIASTMNLFDCFMDDYYNESFMESTQELDIRTQLEGCLFFSFIWSLGATLNIDSRFKFDVLFRGLLQREFPFDIIQQLAIPFDIPKPEKPYIFTIPTAHSVFDYRYIKEGKGKWKLWSDELINNPPIPRDIPANQILVTTVETIRNYAIMQLLIQHQKTVMFVGPTGTGKSVYVSDFISRKNDINVYQPLFINFSAHISANTTQKIILSKLHKRRKGVYGPRIGKRCVIFVDDVSMPIKETYGAQPPIELLRQWLDHYMWYDLKETVPLKLIDIQFICAMGPPFGGKTVTPRFSRHFCHICIDEFQDEVLTHIFSKIMLWHLDTRGFSKEFDPCIEEIVSATLCVYRQSRWKLLPTPGKSHYLFNVRDFSRVIQGVLLSSPESIEDLVSMKRLWVHEVLRVYYDRLIDDQDRTWLLEILHNISDEKLKENFNKMFQRLASPEIAYIGEMQLKKLIYCDFANAKADQKLYIEVVDLSFLKNVVEGYVAEFNNISKKPINLVLFSYALEHLSRICRIIKQSRGHALLVGIEGTGKQSLARLATHISEYGLFQIDITQHYSSIEWHKDIKSMMRKIGAGDKHGVFLLSDTQLKEESFLEDVCNLLNFGEVPNIYNIEETFELCEKMRELDKQKDKSLQTDGSSSSLFNLFIHTVREQLHMILTMTSTGNNFRTIIRKYPTLINCCLIDWFELWPEDALLDVATKFLNDIKLAPEEQQICIKMCLNFHNDAKRLSEDFCTQVKRSNFVATTSYLELINIFKELLHKKRKEILQAKSQYDAALDKLSKIEAEIPSIKEAIANIQPQLTSANANIMETMAKLSTENEQFSTMQEMINEEAQLHGKHVEALKTIKDEYDADLMEAISLKEAATDVVIALTAVDLAVLKTIKNPSRGVKMVVEAVCLLKDIQPEKIQNPSGPGLIDDYWSVCKKEFGDNFLDSLIGLDKDNIPLGITKKITEKFLNDEDFLPEKLKGTSQAAEILCKWIMAIVNYDKIAKVTGPKEATVKVAEEELRTVTRNVDVKRALLREIRERVISLEAIVDGDKEKLQRLNDQVQLSSIKLQRAQELIAGVGKERAKWLSTSEKLANKYDMLFGDALISSGIIAYLGPFTFEFRQRQINQWIGNLQNSHIICSSNFQLNAVLGELIIIRQWNIFGLPTDLYTIDNAIIVKNCHRWPLMIDPEGQGIEWLKNLEKSIGLAIIRLNQSDYLRILENAIQFGQPVLLENVGEELDPILEPILARHFFKKGSTLYLKIGESILEYNNAFKMYIATKLRNPQFQSKIVMNVNLINFTLTKVALEDQLLGITIAKERPDLETEKTQLIRQSAENHRILKEIEGRILDALNKSEENILEEESLIQSLISYIITSNEIVAKQVTMDEIERQIDKSRAEYISMSTYSSILYSTIVDLSQIDRMYQYSLRWFVHLCKTAIDNTEKVDNVVQRLQDLKKSLTFSLYDKICRGLSEKHKLSFSLLLTINLMKNHKNFMETEWAFFLIDNSINSKDMKDKSPIDWLDVKSWNEICKLDNYQHFAGIKDDIFTNVEWKKFVCSPQPQNDALPGNWNQKLTEFQQLLILKCVRRDKLIPAVRNFIQNQLGAEYIEPPPFDLSISFKESNCCTPLIFLLIPGVDPVSTLLQFAQKHGFSSRLILLSLGRAQEAIATNAINKGLKSGHWVVLQNCHLAKNFMVSLEKVCEHFSPETVHRDFRLWLTSFSNADFPNSILRNGIKIVYDPSEGLKTNIIHSYLNEPICSLMECFEGCNQTKNFKRLLYALSFFHALVQERKKFGPLGWNIPYQFNETDLKINVMLLQMVFNEYSDLQYDAFRYLTGECNYGGRIMDNWDLRCLTTILNQFCNKSLIEDLNYAFDPAGLYHCPNFEKYDDFMSYTKSFPYLTQSSVFGMTEDINLAINFEESNFLLNTVLITQDYSLLKNDTPLNEEMLLETVIEILGKLSKSRLYENALESYTMSYTENFNNFLVQEMMRYNNLLTIIRISLEDVGQVVKGLTIMTPATEQVMQNIWMNKIPQIWVDKSYPSLKSLGSYIKDLISRIQFLEKWYYEGVPTVFWISGFFSPLAFLAAVIQTHARKHKISVDLLTFDSEVLQAENIEEPPTKGVVIYGHFLHGARWNMEKKSLDETLPRNIYNPVPLIHMMPIESDQLIEKHSYLCPVYQTAERRGMLSTTGHSTNFLIGIALPTLESAQYWIIRGVAMLCQLSE